MKVPSSKEAFEAVELELRKATKIGGMYFRIIRLAAIVVKKK